jgi:prophage regulatory protein
MERTETRAHPMASPAPDLILPPNEVVRRTNLSRATLYRMWKRSEFPSPIQLSPRRIGFSSAQVESWLQQRMAHAA